MGLKEKFKKYCKSELKLKSEVVLGMNREKFFSQYQVYINMWLSTVLYIELLFSCICNPVTLMYQQMLVV